MKTKHRINKTIVQCRIYNLFKKSKCQFLQYLCNQNVSGHLCPKLFQFSLKVCVCGGGGGCLLFFTFGVFRKSTNLTVVEVLYILYTCVTNPL